MKRAGFVLVAACFTLLACSGSGPESGDESKPEGGHVWKDQTDALKKAQGVEQLILDSAEQQRQQMERDTQ